MANKKESNPIKQFFLDNTLHKWYISICDWLNSLLFSGVPTASPINENIKLIKTINGQYDKVPLPCESESRKQARRSIIAKDEIKEGTVISEEMLTYKRPGTGISPSEIENVIGKKAKIDIAEDELIKYEYLE